MHMYSGSVLIPVLHCVANHMGATCFSLLTFQHSRINQRKLLFKIFSDVKRIIHSEISVNGLLRTSRHVLEVPYNTHLRVDYPSFNH